LAGVCGFVDAIADGQIGTLEAFATGNVDDVGIGRSDGDGADGAGVLMIKDGIPGAAEIVSFPDAAVDGADVEDVRLRRDTGEGAGAAATDGADGAPIEFVKRGGSKGLGGDGKG